MNTIYSKYFNCWFTFLDVFYVIWFLADYGYPGITAVICGYTAFSASNDVPVLIVRLSFF